MTLFSSQAGSGCNTEGGTTTLIKYADVIDIANLRNGLERTKASASPGLDNVRKSEFTEEKLTKLHKELVSQTYQPKPTKRVPIPKPDGGTRFLGISSQRDKVVQGALLVLLEGRLEKVFSPISYGFRPGKNCHLALKHIKTKWQNITWFINVDIKKCFDTINHKILLKNLSLHVDQATVELVSKMIAVGYVEFPGGLKEDSLSVGTPQGSLISPILCNLYLDNLDRFISENLLPVWNEGDERSFVSGYQSRKSLDNQDKAMVEKYPELEGQIGRIKHNRWLDEGLGSRDPQDQKFRRLGYVRYADDFMLGFCGTKAEADNIFAEIQTFLEKELKFQINSEKSSVSHSGENGTLFLGTFIKYIPNKLVIDPNKSQEGEIHQLKSVAINNAQLRAPIERVMLRAVEKGYAVLKENGVVRATSCRKISSLTDSEIVMRYSSIIRGILQYYSFVNSMSDLWPVVSLYRKSAALTLADKHKLGTAARVFKQYGPSLTIKNEVGKETTKLFYPDTLKTTGRFILGKEHISLALLEEKVMGGSYKSNPKTDMVCQYEGCNSTEKLEEHHLNPQSNISKNLTAFEQKLISHKRKTVTLCQFHHKLLHGKKVL